MLTLPEAEMNPMAIASMYTLHFQFSTPLYQTMLSYYCYWWFYCLSTIPVGTLWLPLHLLQKLDRVLLEKITDSQIVKKSPLSLPQLYGTKGLIIMFIEGATCPDHERDHPSPNLHSVPSRFVLILSSHLPLRFKVVYFTQVSQRTSCMHLSSPEFLPQILSI